MYTPHHTCVQNGTTQPTAEVGGTRECDRFGRQQGKNCGRRPNRGDRFAEKLDWMLDVSRRRERRFGTSQHLSTKCSALVRVLFPIPWRVGEREIGRESGKRCAFCVREERANGWSKQALFFWLGLSKPAQGLSRVLK